MLEGSATRLDEGVKKGKRSEVTARFPVFLVGVTEETVGPLNDIGGTGVVGTHAGGSPILVTVDLKLYMHTTGCSNWTGNSKKGNELYGSITHHTKPNGRHIAIKYHLC